MFWSLGDHQAYQITKIFLGILTATVVSMVEQDLILYSGNRICIEKVCISPADIVYVTVMSCNSVASQ
jgi:hypothetical protein